MIDWPGLALRRGALRSNDEGGPLRRCIHSCRHVLLPSGSHNDISLSIPVKRTILRQLCGGIEHLGTETAQYRKFGSERETLGAQRRGTSVWYGECMNVLLREATSASPRPRHPVIHTRSGYTYPDSRLVLHPASEGALECKTHLNHDVWCRCEKGEWCCGALAWADADEGAADVDLVRGQHGRVNCRRHVEKRLHHSRAPGGGGGGGG